MKKVLTVPMLDALKPVGKDYVIGDAEHKGLAIRVSALGAKTWVFPHRSPKTGKGVNMKLGRYPTLSRKGARAAWTEARKALDEGRDPRPFAFGKDDGAPVNNRLGTTYGALVAIYDQVVLVKQRTRRDRYRMLVRMGERFGWTDRIANEITPSEAWAALKHMVEAHGPVAALAMKSILRTLFRWARQDHHGYVATNPFGDLEAPARKNPARDRTLSIDELLAVWNALDDPMAYEIEPHYAVALKLIFLTGGRPGMVVGMERGELKNLDAPQPKLRNVDLRDVSSIDTRAIETGPLWDLPGERMKKGKRFLCPLGPLAIKLIKSSPSSGKFIVAAPGCTHLSVGRLSSATRALYKALGIPHFTSHDMRRTAATMLGEFGWATHDTGLLLAHAPVSVTGRVYDHSKGLDKKRAMVLLLEKIITDRAPDKTATVVAFRAA